MGSRKTSARRRIGRVSLYEHHGGHWLYHTAGGRPVRRLVGDSAALAECEASLLNAQLVAADAGLALASVPAARRIAELLGPLQAGTSPAGASPLPSSSVTIPELRSRFVGHHERVLASSLATVNRYRSATLYLENFAKSEHVDDPMRVPVAAFVERLRAVEVSPNGHARAAKRRLRDKGIRFILESCRSMYRFGQPPQADDLAARGGNELAQGVFLHVQ